MNDLAVWLDRHNISVMAVLATVGLVVGAFALSYLLKRPLQDSLRQLASRVRLPYETVLTTTRLLIGALWIVVAMLVLEIWGISVGGLWTLLVSAATIVGVGFLATWTMVSNITASFFIALWRPFHLGDDIEIVPENLRGRVIDSNLMFVVVRENGGAVIQIPNNLFFQKMFRVIGSSNKTLFEEYEADRDLARRARLDPTVRPLS
jgi:small-conductance mechanosensitive channel